MGIKLQNIDKSNVVAVINLYHAANILDWINPDLITYDVCLASVKANGLSVKFVPDKYASKEILLIAIKENHHSLSMIPNRLIDVSLVEAATESLIRKCKTSSINFSGPLPG
jgi:hypothetical protein